MENKFLCCSRNSTHNDHWFTFNFLLHCCSMHRPEGASYLGVRPPLDRPQLCWWLPQLSQILPTAPLRVPPHPAGTAGQTAVGISRRQLLILLHARLLSLKICGAQHSHGTATVQALLLLWNGRLMVGDLARSERLRPACVFTRLLCPSHPFFKHLRWSLFCAKFQIQGLCWSIIANITRTVFKNLIWWIFAFYYLHHDLFMIKRQWHTFMKWISAANSFQFSPAHAFCLKPSSGASSLFASRLSPCQFIATAPFLKSLWKALIFGEWAH